MEGLREEGGWDKERERGRLGVGEGRRGGLRFGGEKERRIGGSRRGLGLGEEGDGVRGKKKGLGLGEEGGKG